MPDDQIGAPTPLFRTEATQQLLAKGEGAIVLSQPVRGKIALLAAVALGFCLASYIVAFDYTKTITISGELNVVGGNAAIIATEAGRIRTTSVKSGALVEKGQPLFSIVSQRDSGAQVNDERITAIIDSRLAMLKSLSAAQRRVSDVQSAKSCEQVQEITSQLNDVKMQTKLQQQRVENLRKIRANLETLRNQGYISNVQWLQQENELVSEESRLIELKRSASGMIVQQTQYVFDCREQRANKEVTSTNAKLMLAGLAQEQLEHQLNSQTIYRSPISGTVILNVISPGGSIIPGQELATVMPRGKPVEAVLSVPSRAVAWLKHNQKVFLQVEAFPYQRYGYLVGQVRSIDAAPVVTSATTKQHDGPLYRVFVEVDSSAFRLPRTSAGLMPGMSVLARIEVDRRPIYRWIIDPLNRMDTHG
ncbi:HlyD family efflux transporter periplasmic adaptor subunit [Massilia aerilata]|uniref:HlyD family efflux transporter periplasmic adaptor subunit n=1 Tax=Massilia aerilata TaxID=453817 RepID=A0ABW0S2U3_9BURK